MEREIGKVFRFEGKWLKVQEGESLGSCEHCYFEKEDCSRFRSFIGVCTHKERSDKKGVVFVDITYKPEENLQAEQPQQEEQQETAEPKEREIGEVFEYEGKKLKVMKGEDGCTGCYFKESQCRNNSIIGECIYCRRNDKIGVIFVEVKEEPEEQPQEEQPKLNLCEVLKYCPEGETFWSPMLGDVKLNDIDQESKKINVILASGATWDINADGTITIDNVTSPEVMLYPSCEQMAWTKVKYEKKKELPRTWEEFCKQNELREGEYFLGNCCNLMPVGKYEGTRDEMRDRNILPSKEAAEAHLAYMQLHQLRDAWREEWLPDWTEDNQSKYAICSIDGEFSIRIRYTNRHFLAFQDEKRAVEFLGCFIDFIRKAGDLI